ncbi:MAG: DUF1294 domain-containing protein, partial [Oscillospiraceae bacterium]|nr:DUF1294 domain-containing protein [Oscillospiraceae bacterium]
DKRRARLKKRRVPVKSLLWMAAAFGAAGLWLGMYLFHHKTRHTVFRFGVPAMLFVQAAFCGFLFWRLLTAGAAPL